MRGSSLTTYLALQLLDKTRRARAMRALRVCSGWTHPDPPHLHGGAASSPDMRVTRCTGAPRRPTERGVRHHNDDLRKNLRLLSAGSRGYSSRSVEPAGAGRLRSRIRTASMRLSRTDSTRIEYPSALTMSPRLGSRP